jgi:hypothetical protein
MLYHAYHNGVLIKNNYEGLDLMVVYPLNFAHVKIQP